MKGQNFSRAGRKLQIVLMFCIQIQNGDDSLLTSYAIAKKLNITASSHLRSILEEMDEDGVLQSTLVLHRSNQQKRMYWLNPSKYTPPKKEYRVIEINHNGKSAGQLELFS